LNLFSPETYETFSRSDRTVSGFRYRQRNAAAKIQPGDRLICYMTKLSRWVGVFDVLSPAYEDATPLFYQEEDPFIIRFKVKPLVWLPREKTIPIREDHVWDNLSFTKGQEKHTSHWTGKVRVSLGHLSQRDGQFLEKLLCAQAENDQVYPIDDQDYNKYLPHTVRRADKVVSVSVPQDTDSDTDAPEAAPATQSPTEARESIKIQAMLANIGAKMGLRIWLPRSDRNNVLNEWPGGTEHLLNVLPLNYDETTLKTVEQIDVLWLRGRSIVRAFEVEHTTSIYSGILRMADLLALQPNMAIKLHIVAPYERRDKVFQEVRRPVFSLLEKGPLSDSCTFLSYDSVRDLAKEKHLTHLSDSVLDDYAEEAE
jgi:predicted RNA-binding protein